MLSHLADALADLRETFPRHQVRDATHREGWVWVTLASVDITAGGWTPTVIDLSTKLLPTFPITPPYPFYGPPGLRQSNGRAFSPTQTNNLSLEGPTGAPMSCSQISLRHGPDAQKDFDPLIDCLGARFRAVIAWLRDPR